MSLHSPPSLLREHIEKFLYYCVHQKRLSANTHRGYECDLRYFVEYLESLDPPVTKPEEVTKYVLEDYLSYLNQSLKVRTIRRKFAAIRSFFSYLEYYEILTENPMLKFRMKLRDYPSLPNTLSIDEVAKILHAVYHRPAEDDLGMRTKIRDIAIIEMLFALGLRVSELAALTLSDYQPHNHSFRILGKGSKERSAYLIDPSAQKALSNWLAYRESLHPTVPNIFINRYGGDLSPITIRWMIHKYADMAGIEHRVTPHSFRHSFASSLLEQDVDSKYIQELLGHSSIHTTQLYLHTTEEKKVELLKRAHPRKNIHPEGVDE